jgi:two-component system, LytTR family, response regulator
MKAVIIDDESSCRKTLQVLLAKYCPEVTITGVYSNGQEALAPLQSNPPDLVFLDVEMPLMNGFDMLQKLPMINFSLVFTTSYDQYALKAFRFSAIDYLLKPIDKDALVLAVEKVQKFDRKIEPSQLEMIQQNFYHPFVPLKKIALPTMEGLQMAQIEDILYAESDDNYSILYFKNKQKLLVTLSLKEIEETLEDHSFTRVHRCYLVNMNHIDKYQKGEGGYLVLSDGTSIDVSRTKKESLLKKLMPKKNGI